LAIIDAEPHAAPAAASIARAADLIAVPCRPTAFDLAAVDGAMRIAKAAGVKAVFVLSACLFRPVRLRGTEKWRKATQKFMRKFETRTQLEPCEIRRYAKLLSSAQPATHAVISMI
jgi:hypothetical protein